MNLWTWALDLLFPPKCPFCQRVLDDPRAPLCPDCQPKLPWLEGKQAQRKVEFADGCVSVLAYRGQVAEAVRRYKFARCSSYAAPLGRLVAQCVQDHWKEPVDGLTWTPLSKKRLRERGFDQAELLAREAGKQLGLPVFPTLRKVRHTQPQSGLTDPAARRANALNAYDLLPGKGAEGRRLILVDDVVTSGATLGECARLLRQGGARRVYCVTLARAGGGPCENSPGEQGERV